jgi:hypothetical protein
MSCSSRHFWFDQYNNYWWGVTVMCIY